MSTRHVATAHRIPVAIVYRNLMAKITISPGAKRSLVNNSLRKTTSRRFLKTRANSERASQCPFMSSPEFIAVKLASLF